MVPGGFTLATAALDDDATGVSSLSSVGTDEEDACPFVAVVARRPSLMTPLNPFCAGGGEDTAFRPFDERPGTA